MVGNNLLEWNSVYPLWMGQPVFSPSSSQFPPFGVTLALELFHSRGHLSSGLLVWSVQWCLSSKSMEGPTRVMNMNMNYLMKGGRLMLKASFTLSWMLPGENLRGYEKTEGRVQNNCFNKTFFLWKHVKVSFNFNYKYKAQRMKRLKENKNWIVLK